MMNLEFELDHIGVAVKDIQTALPFYRAMGWTEFPMEEVPTEKVKVAFVKTKNKANIELLEPTADDSVIAKFIAKRGPGIHHVCLKVPDIRKTMKDLKAAGVRVLDDEPRPGAHGCLVAFVHPSSTGGILVELSQHQGGV